MTAKTIRALQVLVIFLGVVILVMMGVILTVMSQRIRGASGPSEDAPWQVQVEGFTVEEVTLEGNRATVAIRDLNGFLHFEIYDVRTGALIGVVTVVGP